MELKFAAARRHRHARGGVALSFALHLMALVGLIVVVRTPASHAPVRARRSITFLTFAQQMPPMVVRRAEDVPPSAVPTPPHSPEEPAFARTPESTRLRNDTPAVEAPKPIEEIVSAEVIVPMPSPPVLAPIDSRAGARIQPAVGLFDARPALQHQAEPPAVQLAGFGQAAPKQRADRAADELRPGGFDLRPSPSPSTIVARRDPIDLPVEIIFKPSPDYTEEARALKVEGVVRLEVVFVASGEVRVLRVLDGLGHGLDEAAARAARQIRFRPAHAGGVAVDLRTTLHITFRIS